MLRRVLVIALNTYRESVRARILLALAVAAFAVAFFSLIVGTFTLSSAPRVVSDIGAASISLFAIVVAVVICATSLHRELEQKTLFPILARPIRRGEYLAGKYLGTLLTIAVFIMADAGLVLLISAAFVGKPDALPIGRVIRALVALAVVVGGSSWRWTKARTYGPIPWSALMLLAGVLVSGASPDERRVILGGSLLAFFEVAIVAAIGMLFASFSTPILSAVLTLMMWVVGRNADTLTKFSPKTYGPFMHGAGMFMSKVVPNLHVFVPPRPLFTGEVASDPLGPYVLMAAATSVAWSVGLLAVAAAIFRRRDFL